MYMKPLQSLSTVIRAAAASLVLLLPATVSWADTVPSPTQSQADASKAASSDAKPDASSVAGATELPAVVQNLTHRGVEIVGKLQTPGGLEAYAAIAQQQPLAIYVTPDKQHVIVGTMMDEQGMDVTSTALEQATVGPWTEQTWSALGNSTWVGDGSADAKRVVYMFTDPNCPFCHKFWEQARPWVDGGLVQIRHILVAVLSETSAGKAAAILASADPEKAMHEHESAGANKGIQPLATIPSKLAATLESNNRLMTDLQIEGTPGIFYFDGDGELQIQRGAPLDEHLEEILGPR